jgi:D-alanyl-D-alanine carboxypeptidase
VVLQLVDEGLISLDDTIEQFVSGIPNGDIITLRQLLNMTSGIADFVAVPELAEEYAANPLIAVGLDQILEVIRASPPNFEPGAQVQYCNSNYVLLGLVIEAVTGQAAAVEVQRRIFDALGMTSSSFPMTPWMPEPTMHGYTSAEIGDPLVDVTRSNPNFPWTAGAVISTLADMRTWTVALAEGTLLSPETQQIRLETNPIVTTPVPLSYGLGILDYNGLLGHNGGILGYSSWALHDPESGATFVIVVSLGTEQGGFADGIFRDLMLLFYPERFSAIAATPTPA